MTTLPDLPYFDVIFEDLILPHLDLNSLFQLSLVSSEFNSLVLDYLRDLKCLRIPPHSKKSLKDHHLANLALATGSIKVLDLSGCSKAVTDEILCALLLQNEEIITLDISGCNKITPSAFSDLSMKCFFSLSDPLAQLEHLIADDCPALTGDTAAYLSNTNLKTLSLGGSLPILTTDDNTVREITKYLPHLENINLSRCYKITNASMKHLSRCTKLKILKISGCWRIGDQGLSHIIRGCPDITDLAIDDCRAVSSRMRDDLLDKGILVLDESFIITNALKYKVYKAVEHLSTENRYNNTLEWDES